jgi:hypothetical protein
LADEFFDIVNDRDEVIGRATRCEMHDYCERFPLVAFWNARFSSQSNPGSSVPSLSITISPVCDGCRGIDAGRVAGELSAGALGAKVDPAVAMRCE